MEPRGSPRDAGDAADDETRRKYASLFQQEDGQKEYIKWQLVISHVPPKHEAALSASHAQGSAPGKKDLKQSQGASPFRLTQRLHPPPKDPNLPTQDPNLLARGPRLPAPDNHLPALETARDVIASLLGTASLMRQPRPLQARPTSSDYHGGTSPGVNTREWKHHKPTN